MTGIVGQVKRRRMWTQREKVWTSMRVMRQFSIRDLVATAEASESTVRKYVRHLLQAGYIRVTHRTNFRLLNDTTYRLVRNTGPAAPRVRKRPVAGEPVVWDPNTRELHTRDVLRGAHS